MNSHQRRIERRRLRRAGQPLPLWLWPHTITRASLDEVRPRGKRIATSWDDLTSAEQAAQLAIVDELLAEVMLEESQEIGRGIVG